MAHALDFRGSQQVFNPTSGMYEDQSIRISVRAIPKNLTGGTLGVNVTTGSSISLECIYYKAVIGGKTVIEIDKYNFVCVIDGVDYLAKVRENLGL
ncbi:Phage tail tube protein FII [compost metagenome]